MEWGEGEGEKGMMEALSVRGELAAWQWGFDVLLESGVEPVGAHGKEIHGLDPASRADLERARALIKAVGGPV